MRVAIIGGGMGGLAAAWRLTDPSLKGRFSVTVYERDWRLGGKGASGRSLGPDKGRRIEEHGLHVLMGWYDDALGLLREVYADVAAGPNADRFLDFGDAFQGWDTATFADPHGSPPFWRIRAPRRSRLAAADVYDLFERTVEAVDVAWKELRQAPSPAEALVADASLDEGMERSVQHARLINQRSKQGPPLDDSETRAMLSWIAGFQRGAAQTIWSRIAPLSVADRWRRGWILFWLASTHVVGMIGEGLVLPPRDFSRLDGEDYKDWLRSWGVPCPAHMGWDSPPVRGLYDLAFSHGRTLAAGTTLNVALRMAFDYKGSLAYKMAAGMGDVVFAPLWDALHRRGVPILLHHRIQSLHPDARGERVERIELEQTATGPHANPLIDVPYDSGRRRLACWPSQTPLVGPRKPHAALTRGSDFDVVVFATGAGAIASHCGPLLPHSRALRVAKDLPTTATAAVQLWLERDLPALGWPDGPAMVVSFARPFNSWVDMEQLLRAEDWPAGSAPRGVSYFVNELPDRHVKPDPDAVVKAWLVSFLGGSVRDIWPRFRISDLHAPGATNDQQRIDFQYVRADTEPSSRYVLAEAGEQWRRPGAGGSGLRNLALAGDWVRTDTNSGALESAVQGGFAAADAIISGRVSA